MGNNMIIYLIDLKSATYSIHYYNLLNSFVAELFTISIAEQPLRSVVMILTLN